MSSSGSSDLTRTQKPTSTQAEPVEPGFNPSQLDELLSRWQKLRSQGQPVTIQDLGCTDPAVLSQLRQQIDALAEYYRSLADYRAALGLNGKPKEPH